MQDTYTFTWKPNYFEFVSPMSAFVKEIICAMSLSVPLAHHWIYLYAWDAAFRKHVL